MTDKATEEAIERRESLKPNKELNAILEELQFIRSHFTESLVNQDEIKETLNDIYVAQRHEHKLFLDMWLKLKKHSHIFSVISLIISMFLLGLAVLAFALDIFQVGDLEIIRTRAEDAIFKLFGT